MTIDEFMAALLKRFPRNADEIAAWAPDYRYVLAGMSGEDIAESLKVTLARWQKAWPPKPAEIMKRRVSTATGKRHPLNVQPMDLFGKPFGNGRDIPDLSDAEMREWQWQNGELFLARLPYWNKMRRWMGDDEAAAVLKLARSENEVYRIYDQWRHGEPLDPKRLPPVNPAVHDVVKALAEERRMPGTGTP